MFFIFETTPEETLKTMQVLCVSRLLRALLRCAAVSAVAIRAAGPFRRVRGQALLSLTPYVNHQALY